MNNNAEVGQLGQLGQFGQAHILNSNNYNLLIINDSNILEEKARGVAKLPTCQLFRTKLPKMSGVIICGQEG